MGTTVSSLAISASVRLLLAMFRLYAGVEDQIGKVVLDILRKQYPDQTIDMTASQIGGKLLGIARRELQGNDADAQDAVSEFLTYISVGSRYETDDKGRIQYEENPETGESEPIPRKTKKPFDFTKDSPTWQEALKKMFSNIRTTAISRSKGKMTRQKKERDIDKAFGKRNDSGESEGGEGQIPTSQDSPLGKALDDHAAVREFIDLIDEHVPDLKASLSEDTRKLFDLIFEDEIGSFGSDIKENMGQATALQKKHPELYEKNSKRWSGFVGDLRKKLLKEIWDYVEKEMSHNDFVRLRDQFFADADPSAVRRQEKEKDAGKDEYQQMLDKNKVSRLKAKLEADGKLEDKDQKDLDRLTKRLKEQGVDVDAIKADAGAGAGKKKPAKKDDKKAGEDKESQTASTMVARILMPASVASSRVIPAWLVRS